MQNFFYLLIVIFLAFVSCKKEEKKEEDKNKPSEPIISNLPNGDFENWVLSAQQTYEEPSTGWWATLNPLKNLGGPETVVKTDDAHTGQYAAKLTTAAWGQLTIPGILLSGLFDFNAPNMIIEGRPFTDKPLKFKGYYKYTSVNGDSAAIYANITKYNTLNSIKDTLAEVRLPIYTSVNQYTAFEIDFTYLLPGITPDSLSIVFASSADGANFNGAIGSTLYIDDISLILENGKELKVLH